MFSNEAALYIVIKKNLISTVIHLNEKCGP